MSGVWGRNIRLTIFGESHGEGIGMVLDGLPPGKALDMERISAEMARRKPGRDTLSTPRAEEDFPEILSGSFQGRTTGAPLTAFIRNTNRRSGDYASLIHTPRPGHADYTGNVRFRGFQDYRGGGHFSGRLTAALVFAGAVAKQYLDEYNIAIGSHILSIGTVYDRSLDEAQLTADCMELLQRMEFPVIDASKGEQMKEAIHRARADKDSVGGIVEAAAVNIPAGIGSPFFDSVESTLAHLLFSIPAVKGVEFGAGFGISAMLGSQANDAYRIEEGRVCTATNHNGGILGGITNGMPVVFRAAFKPTPSIAKPQKTVDMRTMTETTLEVQGRHDPCVVPRAVPVVEAVAAIAILDLLLEGK